MDCFLKIACRFEKKANFKIILIKLINLWGFQLDQAVWILSVFCIYPTPLYEGKKSTFCCCCKIACRFEKEANFTIILIELIHFWGFQLDQAVLDFEFIFVSTLPPSKKVKNRLFLLESRL